MIDYNDPTYLQNLMRVDPCFWAIRNKIKLLGGTIFTLEGCEYMGDIMRDVARHMAVMKGAQARITTAFMLREIHALENCLYPQGAIYYFPTEKAVEGFSKTRMGPLINDNPCIKRYVKNTNSVSIKRVGKTFLSLLGAKATTSIQGKKDGTSVRSTPADSIVRDERCLFDDDMADMTEDRLLNSKLKREVDLGTPTIPDFGIDKVFGDSDQKFRMIKCQACNGFTCIADEFPESVKYGKEDSHSRYEPFFGCIKCGKKIDVINGEYVAKFPDKYNDKYPMEGISGYHVSHFITPNCDLTLVMAKWEKALIDRSLMGLFYNKYLGFPFIAIEDRLRQQDVFNCCGDNIMQSSSTVGTAMAADIMKTNRIVIAEKKGDEKAKIIYMARVSGFDALFDLALKFNVKSAVVCLRPYEESARKFQERCQAKKIVVYLSEYRDKQKQLTKTDDESGLYIVHRTEMMDKSHAWVKSGKLELPRRCEEVNVFAKEVCNTAKTLEVDERTGDRIYRYRPVGDKQEHYRHCLNYLLLALMNLHDYQIGYEPVLAGAEDDYNPLTYGL